MATVSDVVFNAADTNRDNTLDINEFRNLVGNTNYGVTDLTGLAAGAYQSSGYTTTTGGVYGADLAYAGAGASSYEYASSSGAVGADLAAVSGANYVASQTAIQQYETDAQGLFRDHNPQIVRRPAPQGNVTYTQNIRVRFLQPPPVPPHGPLIIKEVRPPQPPVPAPLRVRQQAPPLPTPPPLILRERPPVAPVAMRSETVVKTLPALPVPPRSVIIERLPAAPAKPRDIVIERWVPYQALAKRRTIVQRAGPAVQYARPRNVIIQYDAPQVRVVRQFQRLGVTPANPSAYVQTYGAQLLDAQSLVQQARVAGVVEDISPPLVAGAAFAASSGTFYEGGAVDAGAVGLGGASYYESSYASGADLSGAEYGAATLAGYTGAGFAETSVAGLAGVGAVGTDVAFALADTNNDGVLTKQEFQNAGF